MSAGVFRETWRETLRPRRAIPLGLVGLALLSAEWVATRAWIAVAADLTLLVLFVLLSPPLWRALCGPSGSALGWIGLTFVAALVVGLVLAIPPLVAGSFTYVGDPNAAFLLVALFVVGGWGLGRDVELERGVVRAEARADDLARVAEQSQLLALRAQLDPHFLFNTLGAIAEWCRDDPEVAERATLQLASSLRRVFDALQRPTWRLEDEVALLRELAALYAVRDAERFRFAIEVEAELDVEMPPLLLLPILENAIKHGPAAGHDGVVRVAVRTSAQDVIVRVENPGAFGGPRVGGTGLPTLERRLALSFEGRAAWTITSVETGTRAELRFPRATA
ncbi:MAG: histidine kinase [Sandaracinus sp.]|nr:histidine kinase [Sandaracinus sp.]